MFKTLLTSTLVALFGVAFWLGHTLYYEETRYPFVYKFLGADPKLNTAWLSTETKLPCTKLEVIYARGSTEPSPLGYLLGPKFKLATERQMGNDPADLLVVALDYMATFEIPKSLEEGVERLVERVQRRAKQCPSMGFALAGYSQGADVIHIALNQLAEQKDRIKAITVFGFPSWSIGFPPYYTGRVLSLCNPGDRACGGKGLLKHFHYGANDTELGAIAASFLAKRSKQASKASSEPAVLEKLPPVESAAGFLLPWKAWPPLEWAEEFKGGVVPPTVGLDGAAMKDINVDEL